MDVWNANDEGYPFGAYVGKHRGEVTGWWTAYEPKHRAPGGEMAAVGYTLVPVADGSE